MTDGLSVRGLAASGYVGDGAKVLADDDTWKVAVESVVAGLNVTVDNTDPLNPVVSASGGGGAATFIGCKARRTATLSIAAGGTFVAVPMTAADDYDTSTIHDPATNPSRLTVPAGMGGVWRFSATLQWASASTVTHRSFLYYKNGAQISTADGGQRSVPQASTSIWQSGSTDLLLVAGDYIEIFAAHGSGSSLDLLSASISAHFLGAP